MDVEVILALEREGEWRHQQYKIGHSSRLQVLQLKN